MLQPEQVANYGGVALHILLPVLAFLGSLALNAFKKWLGSQTQNNTVKSAMVILADLVNTIVQSLEQTTVQALRDSNGRLDAAVAADIKQRAINKIRELYGPAGLKDLAKRLGTSEDATLVYIGELIEQAVLLLKAPPATLPPAEPAFDPDVFGGMTPAEKAAS